MTTEALLELAEKSGHLLLPPPKGLKTLDSAAVLLPSGTCALMVREAGVDRKAYRERLGHEVGHAEEHAFYTRLSAPTCRDKCEGMAKRWQYRNMVPLDELCRVMAAGIRTAWELSDYFELPEPLIREAVAYYREICGQGFGT